MIKMKKRLLSLVMALVVFHAFSQSVPEAPLKVEFANVNILLNSDARQKVNAEIQRLLTPPNSFLEQKIERMQLYFPIIERILEVENIPDDFKYLAVLESALNADAVSSTNAVGFWQFKDFTAEEMGLVMNRNQDDRKNIHLSTKAAAQYLKKNNQIFKNWISTTLSYTIGAGGASAIVPVDWSFASEIKLDNNNTHPYLIKSIAHKIAFENTLKRRPENPKAFVEFPGRGKSFADIATEVKLSESDIKKNNTWVSGNDIPSDKDYIVLVLTEKEKIDGISEKVKNLPSDEFSSIGYPKLKRITMVVTSTDQPVFYEINDKKGILAQPGDEVAQLSRKGKISISKFLSYNDMTDRDLAKEGTVYYLQKKYRKAEIAYHTLADKQTLWDVAHIYGIRLKNLRKYNRIAENEVALPGRVLWLQRKRPKKQEVQYNRPTSAPPEVFSTDPKVEDTGTVVFESKNTQPSSNGGTKVHRVLENETLFSLANKYGTTVEELRKLNNLKLGEGIKYNQRLIVPEPNDEPEDNWEQDDSKAEPVLMPEKKQIVVTTPTTEKAHYTQPTSTAKPVAISSHHVQPGETLFSIATRYGLTVEELRSLNNLTPFETLKSGQVLKVTGKPTSSPQSDLKNEIAVPRNNSATHIVARGETLFSIANKYGLTVDELKNMNSFSGNSIMVGQKIRVNGVSSATTSGKILYHTVKAGETLFSISNKYGISVNDIKQWNNLSTNKLLSGKKIIVKK